MNAPEQSGSRRLALVAVSAALIGGLGCATTALVASSTQRGPSTEGAIAWTDTIVALGRPGPELARKINNPSAMAFLGTEHTYLLVTGGETLANVAKGLDPARVELTADNHALYVENGATWGHVSLKYSAQPDATFSEDESKKLLTLGFVRRNPKTFVIDIPVEGKIYPPLVAESDAVQKLSQRRTLVFHNPAVPGGHPSAGNLIALPATLALDIVTAPLQLIGLMILGLH